MIFLSIRLDIINENIINLNGFVLWDCQYFPSNSSCIHCHIISPGRFYVYLKYISDMYIWSKGYRKGRQRHHFSGLLSLFELLILGSPNIKCWATHKWCFVVQLPPFRKPMSSNYCYEWARDNVCVYSFLRLLEQRLT